MQKAKTHFEQIPVKAVKQIAEQEDSKITIKEKRSGTVAVETPATKTEPYSMNISRNRA
jgi:hypothetical protein